VTSTVVFLFYALLAASLDNLGQGLQKGGAVWFELGPKGLFAGKGWGHFSQWVAGIVMCIAAPFVLALSLARGPASFAAALGVFGLVPLYLYASLVLKETITRWHASALCLILGGTTWIGWKSAHFAFQDSEFRPDRLGLILGVSLGFSSLWCLVAVWRKSPYLGFALGTLSGIIGGLNLLVLKWGALVKSWWATGAVWVLLAIVAFAVLQVAYTKSTALQVVPSNTSVAVLFPMLVSPVLFSEPLPGWLLIGSLPSFLAIGLLGYGEREALNKTGQVLE
jgi:drug/metabolite transporter (DMT)-like permease